MCEALDLNYQKTKESQDLLVRAHCGNAIGEASKQAQRQLWSKLTDMRKGDLYDIYTERSIMCQKPMNLKSSQSNAAEARHH